MGPDGADTERPNDEPARKPRDRRVRPFADWRVVQERANLLRELRHFFDSSRFVEIETPLLSHNTVVDRHLDPLAVTLYPNPTSPHEGPTLWLQTSPEFAMKRALCHYSRSIYQITRGFRAGESGRLHNPEFTILEWYQTPATYDDGMELVERLVDSLLDRPPTQRIRYADAFDEHLGIDPHRATIAQLKACAAATGYEAPDFDADQNGWLDWLLSECIQPHLGCGPPVILYDYPASQAALAKISPGPPPVAERFELYVDGIELANGYHELDDPVQLIDRAAAENKLRAIDGKFTLPETSWLADAMADGLPPSAGVALGVDRLLMVRLGLNSIDDVLTFPISRA
jgi:lysyl-tRNA synthetase class 2